MPNELTWSISDNDVETLVSKNNTNNFAEYKALILGLHKAVELKINHLHIQGDSQLILNQVYGNWNVKNATLKLLHNEANNYNKQIETITFEHIKRNKNKRADELANIAMDNYKNQPFVNK